MDNPPIPLRNFQPAKKINLRRVPKRRWASFGLSRVWYKVVHNWWAWESLASVISIAATAGLIVTLAVTDGHKQPSWGIGGAKITLNAIVAAIATVIRTALMIVVGGALSQNAWNWYSSKRATGVLNAGKPLEDLDTFADAGSDPWASVILIWRTRGRALATLGALLTILSLAFDTFAQQVLTTRTRHVNELGSTGLPRAMKYVGQAGTSTNVGVLDAPISVEAAILSSLIAADTSEPVGQCPTGECTWPLTPTLGVCSSCVDVNSQIWLNEALLPDTIQYQINNTRAEARLDMSLVNWVQFAEIDSVGPIHTENPSGGRLVIAQTGVLGVSPSNYRPLLQVLSVVPDNTTIPHIPEGQIRPLVAAYTCSLFFCIQAFEARTTAGVTVQTLKQTWDQFKHTNDGFWSPMNVSGSVNLYDPSDYQVEDQSFDILGSAIAQVLIGVAEVWRSNITNPVPETVPLAHFVGQQQSLVGIFAEAVWQASNSTASITQFFERMATSFTNFMRTTPTISAPQDKRYASVVSTNEIYVHVRWGWLAFPLSIVLLSHVFLVLTIHQTRRRRVQPWKGARIPLLLASIDNEVRQAAKGGLYSRAGLEKVSGQMKVRLEYDDGDDIAFKRM